MKKEILRFEHVSKKYGETYALRNFSISMEEGDFLCVVGTSGSGKTTMMKMVNGLILPDEGKVLLHGKSVCEGDVIALRKKIGYAIQGNGLFPHMTVRENISYVLSLEKKSKQEMEERVDEMLALVGLPKESKEKYPDELSGGQQQRVGIARAYANRPDILLMDEPFGAVDSITRYQLQQDLKEIHKKTNCTVIFITHDIYEAFKLGTHILVLDKGEIMQHGSMEEVKANPEGIFVKKLIDMAR